MKAALMPNAAQTTYQLIDALRRAGWGILKGSENRCARSLLETLAGTMRTLKTDGRGYMTITAAQLADRAGYSERHVRRWLPILEDLGILSWSRGWIEDGRPQPGSMKINKKVLVKLVNDARIEYDQSILPLRAARTRARLAKLRLLRIKPYQTRSNARADMKSRLTSIESAHREARERTRDISIPKEESTHSARAVQKDNAMTKRITYQAYMSKRYPNQQTEWYLIADRDPIAQEILDFGTISADRLQKLLASEQLLAIEGMTR